MCRYFETIALSTIDKCYFDTLFFFLFVVWELVILLLFGALMQVYLYFGAFVEKFIQTLLVSN